jgi:hypothetical protein
MGFREWLLNEDPNGLGLGSGNYDYCDFRDADAVPFIVYGGGYIRASTHDTSLTHVHMYLSSLRPDNPVSEPVIVKGSPPVLRGADRTQDNFAGEGREAIMRHMVLGRLWTAAYCWSDDDGAGNRGSRRRVISFWNPSAQVMPLKGEILSMIKEMDMEDEYTPGEKGRINDPRDYQYEVQGRMMSYDEFVGGAVKKANPLFDPSKVHTMPPGPVKGQLMGAMGFMSSKPVDVRSRVAREGD